MFLQKEYKYDLENFEKESAFLFDVFVNNFYSSKSSEAYFVLIPFEKFRNKVSELLPDFKGQESVFYELLGFAPEDLDLCTDSSVGRLPAQSNLGGWTVLLKVKVGSYLDVSVVSSLMSVQEISQQNESEDTLLELMNKTAPVCELAVDSVSLNNVDKKRSLIFNTPLLFDLVGFIKEDKPLILGALKDGCIKGFIKTTGLKRVLELLDCGDSFERISSYYLNGAVKGFKPERKEAYRVFLSSLFNLRSVDLNFLFLRLGFTVGVNKIGFDKKHIENFLTRFSSGNDVIHQNVVAVYFKNPPSEGDISELKYMIGEMILFKVKNSLEIPNIEPLPVTTDLSEEDWEQNLKVSFISYLGYRISSNPKKFNVSDLSSCVASIFKESLTTGELVAIGNVKKYIESELSFSEIKSFELFRLLNIEGSKKVNPFILSLIFFNVSVDDSFSLLNKDLQGHFISTYMKFFDLSISAIVRSSLEILRRGLLSHSEVIDFFSECDSQKKCYYRFFIYVINHHQKFIDMESLKLSSKALGFDPLIDLNIFTKTALLSVDILEPFPANKESEDEYFLNNWVPNVSLILVAFQRAIMDYSNLKNCDDFRDSSLVTINVSSLTNRTNVNSMKFGFFSDGYRLRVIHRTDDNQDVYSLIQVLKPVMIDLNNCQEIEHLVQYFLNFLWGKVGTDKWQSVENSLKDIVKAKITSENLEGIIYKKASNHCLEFEENENFKL